METDLLYLLHTPVGRVHYEIQVRETEVKRLVEQAEQYEKSGLNGSADRALDRAAELELEIQQLLETKRPV